MCTCGVHLLFTAENAELRYRAVPDRYLSFPSFELQPGQWDDLQIPVGLAFFFVNSMMDRTVCFYPGPAGAAESELPLDAWLRIVDNNPKLRVVLADVEALMFALPGLHAECFLVPIDVCYELVGRLRRVWRGFDGGQDARREIDDFFRTVAAKARVA